MDFTFAFDTTLTWLEITEIRPKNVAQMFLQPPHQLRTPLDTVKVVYKKFKECLKEASRVFLGGFMDISWVFQEILKCLSGKFQCCFNDFSKVVQGSFQEVSKKFQ